METPNYTFDANGLRFVALDSATGISAAQLVWLPAVLDCDGLVVVFCHHELHDDEHHAVAAGVADTRSILEAAGNVVAVFTGHSHRNHNAVVNGVPYYVMQAATRGPYPDNAYAPITLEGGQHHRRRERKPSELLAVGRPTP